MKPLKTKKQLIIIGKQKSLKLGGILSKKCSMANQKLYAQCAFNFPQCQWPRETESRVNELVVSVFVQCRKPPPTIRFSVSPLEITDAQIQLARVGFVPETDTRSIKVGVNLRPTADAGNLILII
jgi:hypothetical protein